MQSSQGGENWVPGGPKSRTTAPIDSTSSACCAAGSDVSPEYTAAVMVVSTASDPAGTTNVGGAVETLVELLEVELEARDRVVCTSFDTGTAVSNTGGE
eukprot:CAMPEP_0175916666 /NCGR_PEP_ID=MMETSP0108-20121206/10965_1 /TAXON_ID=195067 ORGANISM="Goniomonas pacifica, Strain CCMP1869" /NCGR_SAMPLE_ID=MMETSP0108 /ASSEMBLY_ACC=CAM_ASM_000204 /LENGTH=98 /DNA_ID=CAMNT_0017239227 /DNA_START=733 /DNA_END=1029 /DNA_ORIENTATION=-